MVDARTKLDIIYQEAMGDVHEILDRVDVLKAELPAAADALGDKLNVQTGHLLVAAEKLAGVLQGMAAEVDRAAAQATFTATVAAKLDVRQAATEAATAAINQTVGGEVAKVVGQVSRAAADLVQETKNAREEIGRASKSVSWGFGRILGLVIAGGVMSALITLLGARYVQRPQADPVAQLSKEDQLALANGKAFNAMWPKMTAQEQARFTALAKTAGQ